MLSPAVLAGAVVAVLVVLATLVFLSRRAGGGSSAKGGAKQRDTVVIVGPSDAGKTVLLHQVRAVTPRGGHARPRWPLTRACVRARAVRAERRGAHWRDPRRDAMGPRLLQIMRGKTPETVMSIKPGSLRGKPARLGGASGTPSVHLVDLPGHPQLKTCVRVMICTLCRRARAVLKWWHVCAGATCSGGFTPRPPPLALVLPWFTRSSVLDAASRAAGIVFLIDGSAPYDSSPSNVFRAAAE